MKKSTVILMVVFLCSGLLFHQYERLNRNLTNKERIVAIDLDVTPDSKYRHSLMRKTQRRWAVLYALYPAYHEFALTMDAHIYATDYLALLLVPILLFIMTIYLILHRGLRQWRKQ
ncbi:TPA: hypothetical protein KD020_003720 [Vibrio parahaemolyticus]|nr:hypothetical protein [Vibrio parahaemolyticus]HBN6296729.1 hypothetical protein [Vibrio parahaemolyticus]